MKLHFSASEHDEAKLRLAQLTGLYGQTKIEDATHIVALGGDGHMLHVLQDSLSYTRESWSLYAALRTTQAKCVTASSAVLV